MDPNTDDKKFETKVMHIYFGGVEIGWVKRTDGESVDMSNAIEATQMAFSMLPVYDGKTCVEINDIEYKVTLIGTRFTTELDPDE